MHCVSGSETDWSHRADSDTEKSSVCFDPAQVCLTEGQINESIQKTVGGYLQVRINRCGVKNTRIRHEESLLKLSQRNNDETV